MLTLSSNDNPNGLTLCFVGPNNLLVVKKSNSAVIVAKQSLRFINQLAVSSQRPCNDTLHGRYTPAYSAKEFVLHPGEQSALLMNYHQRKYWIVLRGLAQVSVNGETLFLSEHKAVLIPAMTEHRIDNVNDTDLVFIEFCAKDHLSGDEMIRFEQQQWAESA
jgi:mannose-6-phosphate isomerase-like protein (cupin superfamily)